MKYFYTAFLIIIGLLIAFPIFSDEMNWQVLEKIQPGASGCTVTYTGGGILGEGKYDTNGNLLVIDTYNSDKEAFEKNTVYEYEKGLLKKVTYFTDGAASFIVEYFYVKSQISMIKSFTIKDGKQVHRSTTEYKYGKSGNKVQTVRKDDKGTVIGTEDFKYNKKGILISSYYSEKSEKGEILTEIKIKYNEKGHMIEELYNSYADGWEMKSYLTYKYNSKGNIVQIDYFDSESREKNTWNYYIAYTK